MSNIAILPTQIINDPRVEFNELKVFIALCYFANSRCNPSLDMMSEYCCIKSNNLTNSAIQGLEIKGYVKRGNNSYTILFDFSTQVIEEGKDG